jgi:hypothetical protein
VTGDDLFDRRKGGFYFSNLISEDINVLGTIVNTIAIILGSLTGYFFKNLIPERFSESIMKSISLAIVLIGIKMAIGTGNVLLVICSMVIGTLMGEVVDIESKLEGAGDKLQNRIKGDSNISQGLVTSSLMYCVGSMAIIGAIEGGLLGKHDVLFAKSLLDGIISIALTASLGIGVIFSSIPVFLYQGSIVLLAGSLRDVLTDVVINEMSAVGGLLIMSLGLNVIIKERIKVGNMLPALFIPLIYYVAISFI